MFRRVVVVLMLSPIAKPGYSQTPPAVQLRGRVTDQTASRLPGEPLDGVLDIHTHPVTQRMVRIALRFGF